MAHQGDGGGGAPELVRARAALEKALFHLDAASASSTDGSRERNARVGGTAVLSHANPTASKEAAAAVTSGHASSARPAPAPSSERAEIVRALDRARAASERAEATAMARADVESAVALIESERLVTAMAASASADDDTKRSHDSIPRDGVLTTGCGGGGGAVLKRFRLVHEDGRPHEREAEPRMALALVEVRGWACGPRRASHGVLATPHLVGRNLVSSVLLSHSLSVLLSLVRRPGRGRLTVT